MADDSEDDDIPEVATSTIGVTPKTADPATLPTGSPVSGSSSIDSMLTDPAKLEAAKAARLAIQQQKTQFDTANADKEGARLAANRADVDARYKATAFDPSEIKDFDAAGKSKEYSTDPVQAFGSLGSVFAMLAAGFTKAPMEAALNGGAAAINAIHAQDDKAYQRDFDAWKQNTDLALKRHEIVRQSYNDAVLHMNTDINAGRTMYEMAARKFDDKQALALMENGFDDKLDQLAKDRDKTALELAKAKDGWELQHEKVSDLRTRLAANPDPAAKPGIVQSWVKDWTAGGGQQLKYDAVRDQIDTFKKEHPNYTYQELQTAISDASEAANAGKSRGGAAGAVQDEIDQRTKGYEADGMSHNDAYDKAAAEVKGSKTTKAQAIKQIVKQSEDDVAAGKPGAAVKTLEQATAEYNRHTAAPSGNRLDDINKQIDMYDNGIKGIDRTLALINKHLGAVGAFGYANRLGERLTNVIGSNDTDRSQIAHDIQYLQTVAPRLMLDATSRGLKAEGDRIGAIIAGLNIGDTTVNTKRALGEVRELWAKMQQDNLARARGAPNQGGYGPGSANPEGKLPPDATSKQPLWMQMPKVNPGPRSEATSDDMAAG